MVCYVKNSVRPLIVGVGLAEVMPTKYIRKNEFKRIWMSKKKKQNKDGRKKGCMVSLLERCQNQQMLRRHGNGVEKLI